jgi:hypothetical protein
MLWPMPSSLRRARPLAAALGLLCLLAAGSRDPSHAAVAISYAGQPLRIGHLTLPAAVRGPAIDLAQAGHLVPRFWPGVNLGSTVPGTLPGEVAPTRADYDRWLAGMGRLGARVVRVYTILRPQFYDALASHDRAHPGAPLYFIQGVWIPEDRFLATQNLYDPAVVAGFRREIADAVAVVHGDASLPLRHGHAGGRYTSDVSRWLLAWSPGVEWDPVALQHSQKLNTRVAPYHGRYVTTRGKATSSESWLASMLDHLATLEAGRGWSRPVTFTNWLTTDPLRHPEEPLPHEDLVSVDAMHLAATPAWPGGFFASYHAYPYYPDFLGLQPGYLRYHRADGVVDPYAGYLHALRAHHRGQAVMITEFGVPTGIGIAHEGPLGRNQGGHSEAQAGKMDADMLRDIRSEEFAGAALFEYNDEWFKKSWNTADAEQPAGRRQLWINDLTNEEHFGLVAVEPGARPVATLDGIDSEWSHNGSQVVGESDGPVREVRVAKDEAFLWLRLRLERPASWRTSPLTLGFDVQPGGNGGLPGLAGVDPAADVAVRIGPGDRASISQAAWTDAFSLVYGSIHGVPTVAPASLRRGSGSWVAPRLMLDRPYVVPVTGRTHPVEVASLGTLGFGSGDPASPGFDARNLVDAHDRVVELRIPWALLGFSDPSSHAVITLDHSNGGLTSTVVGRTGIVVVAQGSTPFVTRGYDWEDWNRVAWHERTKRSWPLVAAAFAEAASAGIAAP